MHRREAPVWWHEPTEHTPDGEGFWSVATHAETLAVQRDPVTYSSERGGGREHGGTLLQDLEVAGIVLNMMDDPRHARIRRLVSAGLTPRTVARLEDELRTRTRALLDHVGDGDEIDFLVDVAAELPMQMICILLGVPEEDRHELWEAVDPGFDIRTGDAAFSGSSEPRPAQARMLEYGMQLIAEKRARPTDDMLSRRRAREPRRRRPAAALRRELYSFFSLLFAAGSETTRNAIAGGLLALDRAPRPARRAARRPRRCSRPRPRRCCAGRRRPRRSGAPPRATRRSAGTTIAAGREGPVLGGLGEPRRARVRTRDGVRRPAATRTRTWRSGTASTSASGANLARLEIRVMFEELLPRFGAFEVVAPVEWTRSNRHTGIRHLRVRVSR